jgi:hypothetical protein
MSAPRCNVYLVPGFFGFTEIGALSYFHRVGETLEEALDERGIDATVIECRTQPTGSIRRRAERLLDHVLATSGLEAEHICFVGHSTGGLDVRLLVTPGVRLREDESEVRISDRTRSVVTVTTPHYGTPMANFFTTFLGRQLLEVLTVMATTRGGRYAMWLGARATRWLARADDAVGRRDTFLDSLAATVLRRVSSDASDPIYQFLREVAADQGAIIQLTPESMHLFNAAVTDRERVRYSSVIAVAPPPPGHYGARDLVSLANAARAGAFTLLHTITRRAHRHYGYAPHCDQLLARASEIPFALDSASNDGIVPTLSQIYGDILAAVVGDHLDVVGQFPGAGNDPHGDWLPSGSRFDEERFRRVWDAIADEIAASLATPA